MSDLNPYQSPESATKKERELPYAEIQIDPKYVGLGGWLILVGIGIIFSPIKIALQLYPMYQQFFTDGSWQMLTHPGSENYDALWAPIIVGEVMVNVGLFVASLVLVHLFFKKKKHFPQWYVGLVVFTIIFIIVDSLIIQSILQTETAFDEEILKDLWRAVLSAFIWIPYMFVSKRVKATFVN